MISCIYQLLIRRGFFITREILSTPPEMDDIIAVKKGSFCPFCSPKVLEKEAVFQTDNWVLLYNITSSHEFGHFLLPTRRHITRFEQLTEQEIKEGLKIQQLFFRVMHDKFGWTDDNTHIQNGPNVNQSVPHFHYKIQHDPNLNIS